MDHSVIIASEARSAHMGPTTLAPVGRPGKLVARPLAETLPKEGRSPNKLLNAHGMRIDPAISEPQPIDEPLSASSAPSPPDAPPAVSIRLKGFTVDPIMLFVVSPMSILIGTFVLTMMIAPACLRRFTRTPSSCSLFLFPSQLMYPHELSSPSTWKRSLRLIGSPCNGPIIRPVDWRTASNSSARRWASSNRTSARQLV